MKITLAFIIQLLYHLVVSEEGSDGSGGSGYSFYKFTGPVSGQVQQIAVHDPHLQHPTLDFVAKPDYDYAYGVRDPHTGNAQGRKETRDGDKVVGEYSLLQPDGSVRIVRYTADPLNGFQASVHYARR